MYKNDDWKKTEEIELDLADMLRRLCRQWKQVLVCALAFAVIAGGYAFVKNRNSVSVQDAAKAEDIELTQEEEQSVASAVELQAEIRGLEEYMEGSLLMKIDPYHKNKVYMLYSIEQAKRKDIQKITETYLNFLANGGAADALKKSGSRDWKMDKSYLAEVLMAYQKTYGSPYLVVADTETDSEMLSEALFYVEITGTDAGMAKQLADDIQSVLKDYSARVKDRAGNHKLTLLSTETAVLADSSLQTSQHDKKAQLAANRSSLKTMTDAFSEKQLAVYQKEAAIPDEQIKSGSDNAEGQETEPEETQGSGGMAGIIKYIILGLAGGIFIYCCIFACWYLFRDTVKSEEEMKDLYAFPFYGGIPLENTAQDVSQQAEAQLLNRIRLACKKQGITKLCAASDFSFSDSEKQCLENMAEQLGRWGIHARIAENAGRDTALWDTLAETGTVLMVCRIGTTTHRMIDDAMRFYGENGIRVTGAMAFSQNK